MVTGGEVCKAVRDGGDMGQVVRWIQNRRRCIFRRVDAVASEVQMTQGAASAKGGAEERDAGCSGFTYREHCFDKCCLQIHTAGLSI
eukprot:158253-Pelagomonas_calceolata.AAC.5